MPQPGVFIFGAGHLKIEIGPVVAGSHPQGVLQQQELFYVCLDLAGGCGCKGPYHRALGQLL